MFGVEALLLPTVALTSMESSANTHVPVVPELGSKELSTLRQRRTAQNGQDMEARIPSGGLTPLRHPASSLGRSSIVRRFRSSEHISLYTL